MRIAFVAPFGLRAKGTTRARALPLAKALAGRGHRLALFVPPYDGPEDAGLCWHTDGVTVVNVPLPRGRLDGGLASGLWHVAMSQDLYRAVRGWRPQIIHVFKPKGPSGLVGAALWRTRPGASSPADGGTAGEPGWPGSSLHSFPSSLLVIDSDDWEGPGGWNDDPRAGYSPLQRRFFAWQERYGLAHAHAWTVTSPCLRDRAVEFGAAPERVFLLPNGVSAGAWSTAGDGSQDEDSQSRTPNAQSVLLYTRFAGVRADEVAGIWRRVRATAAGAVLKVVGRGLAGEERKLAAAAPGVEEAGWVEPEAMPSLFARQTLAIVPWADTPANRARSSVKVLELMAAGLPIVAYAVGDLPSILGETGVLVPPGDQVAFARAVAGLLAEPGRARDLGAAARARAATHYTWDRLAEVALAAYAAAATFAGGEAANFTSVPRRPS